MDLAQAGQVVDLWWSFVGLVVGWVAGFSIGFYVGKKRR